MYRSVRRPSRSISQRPTKVKMRLVTPIPMDCSSAAFAARPVSSKMRGAKYRIALMPESWLKKAIKMASRIGFCSRLVQKLPDDACWVEAGQFKDARREIQNCVDAGELVEEGNQDGEQDRFLQPFGPETSRRRLLGRGGDDLIRLSCDFCFRNVRFDSLQDLQSGFAVALAAQQPARTFGQSEAEHSVKQRGKRGHAQHPAPCVFADAREQRI